MSDKKSVDFLSKSRPFRSKSDDLKQLICQTVEILEIFDMPIDKMTARRLERMALVFLVVIHKDINNSWNDIKDLSDSVSLKTREIINILNDKYEENISSGSYDDIRRKYLKLLVLKGGTASDFRRVRSRSGKTDRILYPATE